MIVDQLIKDDSHTVSQQTTYDEIKTIFAETDQQFVAVTESNGILLGVICRTDFQQVSASSFAIDELLSSILLFDYYHLLEALREFLKVEQDQLPVVDEEGFYLGVCHLSDVQYHFNRTIGLIEGGSLIILKTKLHNYSLVDVARIVESNQAKVLTHYITSHPDSDNIEIALVLNVNDVNDITSTFTKFDYEVLYTSTATERDDFLKERYDSFMHYLDI